MSQADAVDALRQILDLTAPQVGDSEVTIDVHTWKPTSP